MIRLVQIISDTNIGGGGRSLLNYLACCDRSRFSPSVVLPRGSALTERVRALGVPGAEYAALAGYALLLGGWALGVRYVVCPHCGKPLYVFLRLPGRLPGSCPHCGAEIETPGP